MRLDFFLKTVGLVKTRMTAKRLCEGQKALLNGQPVKPSHEVQPGENFDLIFPLREVKAKILEIPTQKSISKHDRRKYVQVEEGTESFEGPFKIESR